MCVSNFHNKFHTEGSLLLNPSENLKLLVNQFNNNASPKDNITLKMLLNINIMILMNYKL